MRKIQLPHRFWLIVCLLCVTFFYVNFLSTIQAVPLLQDLSRFPTTLGKFTMVQDQTFSEAVIKNAGMDNYLMRQFRDNSGYTIGLYIGYYQMQTEGHIIHSPKHCLPGGGWNTVKAGNHLFTTHDNSSSYSINQWLMQKGGEKQLVQFWYQGRGRIVANEYIDRALMIFDSIFRKRSDGALIRITGPGDKLDHDIKKQDEFITALLKVIDNFIPQ
jgi:EpsI family protein